MKKKITCCNYYPFFISVINIILSRSSPPRPDVRLLDPPQHVPDLEVPGNYWWHNFSSRKPHAGPESSEKVGTPVDVKCLLSLGVVSFEASRCSSLKEKWLFHICSSFIWSPEDELSARL